MAHRADDFIKHAFVMFVEARRGFNERGQVVWHGLGGW